MDRMAFFVMLEQRRHGENVSCFISVRISCKIPMVIPIESYFIRYSKATLNEFKDGVCTSVLLKG